MKEQPSKHPIEENKFYLLNDRKQKDRNYKKEPNGSEAEKYKKWNEKFTHI